MKLTFIGDVHGKVREYKKIVDNCEFSICVGDFGFEKEWQWHQENAWNFGNDPHWVNIGNHDWIDVLKEDHYDYGHTGNFYHFNNFDIFTVRGAESIDKHLRIEGLDWFPNEELNYKEQLEAFDCYCKVKPKIVVSHDCPQTVMEKLFGYKEKSQTRTMLEMMFQEHQPDIWIFGHHHRSKDIQINGTRFVCLNELEKMTIEI